MHFAPGSACLCVHGAAPDEDIPVATIRHAQFHREPARFLGHYDSSN